MASCCDPPAKSNHFVKIILSDDIHSHNTKLMIPRKFVMKYGDNLHTRMNLKTPNGLVWAVDLQRHKDDVWLHNGWFEFAKFYSLQFGNMLVFEYQNHSEFRVLIFDSSSTEIDYPLITKNGNHSFGKSTQVKKRAIDLDDSSDGSDAIRLSKKNIQNFATKVDSHDGVRLRPKSQQHKTQDVCEPATEEAKVRAIVSAGTFRSDNPFFIVPMKPTHVGGNGSGVAVKKTFEERYKMWKHNDQVTLQVNGRTWLVTCDMKAQMCKLRRGWDNFARENSLILGDVCVFELIDACKKLFHVIIYRVANEAKCKGNDNLPKVKSEDEDDRVHKSAIDFKSENPFFRVNIYPTCFYGSMSMSKKFIKRYITKDHCDVTLQVSDGRAWLVKCYVHTDNAKFCAGWAKFARENNLSAGDTCVFELIDPSKSMLNVVIFRTKSSEIK